MTQFNLLVAVALAQEMPLTRLAEMLVLDRTTLARNLKPLERQGLLAIEAGTDRRVHLIRVTPNGLQVLKEALPYWRRAQELVKARLGQKEWDAFSAHLQVAMARIPSS
jgi:DNA-binding MarR family transcriptional regulator